MAMSATASKKRKAGIRVVVCRTGQGPVEETIDGGLESMQKLVGGYIEMVHLGGGISAVCNEEGIMLGLPQNACGFLGDFFFTRTDPRTGDGVSLTDADVRKIGAYYETYRLFRHGGPRTEVYSFGSLDAMHAFQERTARELSERN
jgi:hypothetical protein